MGSQVTPTALTCRLISLRDSPQPPAPCVPPLARGGGSATSRGRKWRRRGLDAAHCVTASDVPVSKMAAAVSGVLGRAGWRLLQLRCLPGEPEAESGKGRSREEA